MSDSHFQLVVIGGGPGGYAAAIKASQLGVKTAIIEKNPTLGGTCLNVGCIPSKALLASSEHYHFAQDRAAAHGIVIGKVSLDLAALMKRKEDVVSRNAKGLDFLMKKNSIERLHGTASLQDAKTVQIQQNGKSSTITADTILLATGSVPVELPSIPFDGKRVISSDQAIALESVPKSMVVIGAGAIGLELGSVWNRLGAKVTILEFLPRVAAGFEPEMSTALQKSFEKQGLEFHLNTKVESAKVGKNSVKITASKEDKSLEFEADLLLVAVGRRPYTEGLGLEKAGVALTERRRIQVDAHGRTTVPNIYALGDVIEGPMLAHKAEEEGVAFAERLVGKAGHVNYDLVPNVIYTSPEAASIGLTEEAAKEKGITIKSGKFNFMANGRALANDMTEGFVKVITEAKTDRVLGVHILGGNASEMIAEAALLMEFGGSAEDLARTMHAHPTMAETLKEAAMAAWDKPLLG